jgi:hypothetical protein
VGLLRVGMQILYTVGIGGVDTICDIFGAKVRSYFSLRVALEVYIHKYSFWFGLTITRLLFLAAISPSASYSIVGCIFHLGESVLSKMQIIQPEVLHQPRIFPFITYRRL